MTSNIYNDVKMSDILFGLFYVYVYCVRFVRVLCLNVNCVVVWGVGGSIVANGRQAI